MKAAARLRPLRNGAPKPPGSINKNVNATLEAICLKCLAKDKTQRYASANGVAQDLVRYREGRETTALPWTRRERPIAWRRRNVVQASLMAAVIAIWIFALVMALSVA